MESRVPEKKMKGKGKEKKKGVFGDKDTFVRQNSEELSGRGCVFYRPVNFG